MDDEINRILEETKRLRAAIAALPHPIKADGKVACPHCSADLHYGRGARSAVLRCETEGCISVTLMIPATPWPMRPA